MDLIRMQKQQALGVGPAMLRLQQAPRRGDAHAAGSGTTF